MLTITKPERLDVGLFSGAPHGPKCLHAARAARAFAREKRLLDQAVMLKRSNSLTKR